MVCLDADVEEKATAPTLVPINDRLETKALVIVDTQIKLRPKDICRFTCDQIFFF